MRAPLVAATLAFSVLACTQRPAPQAPPRDPPSRGDAQQPAEETRQDAPLTVAAGDTFRLALQANLTHGYHWELADSLDAKTVALVRHVYVPYPNPNRAAGSGGTDHWTFRAVARGTTEIVLGHFPPGRGKPAEVRRYTVVVR